MSLYSDLAKYTVGPRFTGMLKGKGFCRVNLGSGQSGPGKSGSECTSLSPHRGINSDDCLEIDMFLVCRLSHRAEGLVTISLPLVASKSCSCDSAYQN
eukprot:sb/3478936/